MTILRLSYYVGYPDYSGGNGMVSTQEFFHELDARIAKYNLLCHPFYKAWTAGKLTRDDLQAYAKDYYHHVAAFPTYLAQLAVRLDNCELRQAVLANMADEKGMADMSGEESRAHSDLWLDFLEGMCGDRKMQDHAPVEAVKELTRFFYQIASDGTPEEALAAFYGYESQVPRVAVEKARGLKEMYGASEKTCGYFSLHATADVLHANVWRQQLGKRLEANPEATERALVAGESAASALWKALDGIEKRRKPAEVAA
ncbi:MAG: iron-containing redox enzyme family protein [Terriglobales bacterium]